MSISSILNIAKSGIFASQTALKTVSHNLSNVNTEGYARQEAVMDEATPIPSDIGLQGNGVTVSQVIGYRDKFLEKTITAKNTDMQEQQTLSDMFQSIESILNEDNSKLSNYTTEFYNSWSDLSTDPTSQSARTALISSGENLARTIRNVYSDLKDLQIEANSNVRQEVDNINRITSEIANLNQKIFEAGSGSGAANDYVNDRTELVKELAGKLDIQTLEDASGRVTIMTGTGKSLVDGNKSYQLQAEFDEDTGFYGISWVSASGKLTDITSDINGGSVKAYLDIRDIYIPEFISDLDETAAGLIQNVNYFHSQGITLNGETDVFFFEDLTVNYAKDIDLSDEVKADSNSVAARLQVIGTDGGVQNNTTDNSIALKIASLGDSNLIFTRAVSSSFAADATDSTDTSALGISGSLVVNGTAITIDAADTIQDIATAIDGDPHLTGVSASVEGNATDGYRLVLQPSDDRTTITLVNGSFDDSTDVLNSLGFSSGGSSFTSYIANDQAKVGEYTKNAEDLLEYQTDTMTSLKNQRASVSGVSLDEELANMLKYQYAYQAAAKLVTLADEMFQTLLEM